MDKARRRHRHVPAFGEWNYYYYSTSSASSSDDPHSECCWWYASPPEEPEACSDAWFSFSYSPPPLAPRRKKPRRPDLAAEADHKPCGCGVVATVRAAPPPGKGVVVVRPVDEDLYQVPPPDDTPVSRLPRRRRAARRSLWMGCLGLNCVASS